MKGYSPCLVLVSLESIFMSENVQYDVVYDPEGSVGKYRVTYKESTKRIQMGLQEKTMASLTSSFIFCL